MIFESPGSIINEEEKDISLPENISRDIIRRASGQHSVLSNGCSPVNGSGSKSGFYLRGVLSNNNINLDLANKSASQISKGPQSVTSNE